jgi:ribosome-binding factor A
MDQHRVQRVSETVREELAEIVGFELSDPRLMIVDVAEVRVAPDLRHAHVLVALNGEEREQRDAMAALEHAKNYLRHELARRLNLRRIPELHFEPASGTDAVERVERLLKRAKKMRRSAENQP